MKCYGAFPIGVIVGLLASSLCGAPSAEAVLQELPANDRGVYLANELQTLVAFIQSGPGRMLYANDFDIDAWAKRAETAKFTFTTDLLVDRFGSPRCLLNADGSDRIRVNDSEDCGADWMRDPAGLFSTLLHETLNIGRIEMPTAETGSVYDCSKKLLAIDPARIRVGQPFVLHESCEIFEESDYVHVSGNAGPLTASQLGYFRAKGYTVYPWRFNLTLHPVVNAPKPDPIPVMRPETMRPLRFSVALLGGPTRRSRLGKMTLRILLPAKDHSEKVDPRGTDLNTSKKLTLFAGVRAVKYRSDFYGDQYEHQVPHYADQVTAALMALPECVRVSVDRQ